MLPRAIPLVVGLTLTAFALGQDGGFESESEPDFYDKKLRTTRALRQQLFRGEVVADAGKKDHAEAIDLSAKEVTYPLGWKGNSPDYTRPGRTEPNKLLKETVDAFEGQLRQLSRNKEPSYVASMQALYSKAVAVRAREMILKGPPFTSVNAARLLALITKRPPNATTKDWTDDVMPRLAGDTAEYLLGVSAELTAADPKKVNDGVRLFLLRTAHDVLAMPAQKPPLYKAETADKAILAAMAVVARKGEFPKATPRGEVEGFKMLRAEALRVVARAATPAVGKERPALVLARVAAADVSVVPEPRPEELVESAIGLSRLVANSAKVADFNADYAAQQVARAVYRFGLAANENIKSKATNRVRPWKVDAARLLEAVEMMRASKDPYVAEAVRQARNVLIQIEAGEVSPADNLGTWIDGDTKPANAGLFKGGEPSAVKPRGVADDE